MRYYLLPEAGNDYKANLHSHSNISDGKLSPAEMKELYKAMGYSILAFTDHDIFIPHNDLTDGDFLALNGYEIGMTSTEKPWPHAKCCHFCCIALDRNTEIQPLWHRELYNCGHTNEHRHLVKFDESKPDFVRQYTPENINYMMSETAKAGFFVTYNHPTWSLESYLEYSQYSGMHAMEMFNGCSIAAGYEDFNPRVYDDMLMLGKRIFTIGTDDNHNHGNDSGIAWTVIRAESLEYESVTDALMKGNFYASMGPKINALYIEDGEIKVECSDAAYVYFTSGTRMMKRACAPEGESINSASFRYNPECVYFRVVIVDKNGNKAYSNAYFADEIKL